MDFPLGVSNDKPNRVQIGISNRVPMIYNLIALVNKLFDKSYIILHWVEKKN